MGIKYTEEELETLLKKNPQIKVSSIIGKALSKITIDKEKPQSNKISLTNGSDKEVKEKKQKSTQSDTIAINKLNKTSPYSYSYSENHFSFIIFGARLLSVNQIFAILQYRKYEIFKYKKTWHETVNKIINEARLDAKNNNKIFPFFSDHVELTLYRQAPKLVDEDAMTTMYKFIIDGIKEDNKHGIIGLIKEDNPKIVHKISCFSEKGEYAIGFKVEKIKEKKKDLKLQDLLIL